MWKAHKYFYQPNDLSRFCHTSFVYSFFFLTHFLSYPRPHIISTYRLQYVSLKPMGIFLHAHSAVFIPNKMHANPWYHLLPSPSSTLVCCFLPGGLFTLEPGSGPPIHTGLSQSWDSVSPFYLIYFIFFMQLFCSNETNKIYVSWFEESSTL